jgi:hypothetical protein
MWFLLAIPIVAIIFGIFSYWRWSDGGPAMRRRLYRQERIWQMEHGLGLPYTSSFWVLNVDLENPSGIHSVGFWIASRHEEYY